MVWYAAHEALLSSRDVEVTVAGRSSGRRDNRQVLQVHSVETMRQVVPVELIRFYWRRTRDVGGVGEVSEAARVDPQVGDRNVEVEQVDALQRKRFEGKTYSRVCLQRLTGTCLDRLVRQLDHHGGIGRRMDRHISLDGKSVRIYTKTNLEKVPLFGEHVTSVASSLDIHRVLGSVIFHGRSYPFHHGFFIVVIHI